VSSNPRDSRYRFVSYNVHACVGRDGAFRPDRIADVLLQTGADFIGLQEVEDRWFEDRPVADYLAARLSMHPYRGATLTRNDSDFGNLLLSSLPANRITQHDISVAGREPRGILQADFDIASRRLKLLVTHLGLSGAERAAQLDELQRLLDDASADVRIILGDLNEWRPFGRLRRTVRRLCGPLPTPHTFPARHPSLALDRICVAPTTHLRSLKASRTRLASVASDHLPLCADIDLAA